MAKNVAGSSDGKTAMVAMVVHGFDDDPRELHEIPEVVAHMGLDCGFRIHVDWTRSSTLPGIGRIFVHGCNLHVRCVLKCGGSPGDVRGRRGGSRVPQSAVDHFR